MIDFMAHMVNEGLSAATIASTVSAIGYVHRMGCYEDPTDGFKVKKALVGVHRLAKSGDQRLPITQGILHKLLKVVDDICKERYDRHMYKAMYLIMFYGLLRVGEITTSRAADRAKVVSVDDIKIFKRGKKVSSVSLSMRDFKHNLPTNTVTLKIHATHKKFCPITHLLKYIAERGANAGPLFIRSNGKPVSKGEFTRIFRKSATKVGLDEAKYKPHSFRIGGATRYAELGYEDSLIQRMGRWKSLAFRRYIRMATYDKVSR